MKIAVCAIGRYKGAVENQLTLDYIKRAELTGRALGVTGVELIEVEPKAGKKAPTSEALKALEAQSILEAVGEGATLIACDERGEGLNSRQIAKRIESFKDKGAKKLVFLIGGADGLDPELRAKCAFSLAFGPQTWPHLLVRVMLAEQIYRAITILSNHPYHRD